MGPTERSLKSIIDLIHEHDANPKEGRPVPIEALYEANVISEAQYRQILKEMEEERRAFARGRVAEEMSSPSDVLAERLTRSGAPQRFARCAVDRTQDRALSEGRWLYVCGSDVERVTSKACGFMKAWLTDNNFGTARFERSTTMLSRIRESDLDAVSQFSTVGLLVISGLGAENISEWTASKINEVLDRRFGVPLPTIVTTRYQPNELAQRYGAVADDIVGLLMRQSILVQT